jgi:glycerol-1-phosphatase
MATWAIDLDGVVWRGSAVLPRSAEAVERLLAAGEQVVFCTNHAHAPSVKERQLAELGVPLAPVVTSAEAAARRCGDGPALVMGDPSLGEYLLGAGVDVVDVWALPDGDVAPAATVVVGATSRWDRSRVGMVADAVRAGALFLATNDDPTYPVHGRLLPGNGALVAAVETASGCRAEVTGKPYAPMAELLVERFGPIDVVVGDKAETDGGLAHRLGARFGLVLSGVTAAEDVPLSPSPWLVEEDLASLVDRHLGSPAV